MAGSRRGWGEKEAEGAESCGENTATLRHTNIVIRRYPVGMTRKEYFTFRIHEDERRILELLAKRLQRTQSDVIRLLIREAAAGLGIEAGRAA